MFRSGLQKDYGARSHTAKFVSYHVQIYWTGVYLQTLCLQLCILTMASPTTPCESHHMF